MLSGIRVCASAFKCPIYRQYLSLVRAVENCYGLKTREKKGARLRWMLYIFPGWFIVDIALTSSMGETIKSPDILYIHISATVCHIGLPGSV